MKKLRIATYIRVSTDEQAKEWFSLDAQVRAIKAKITTKESEWWEYDENLIFRDEWFSWTLKRRPALDELLKKCRNKEIDVIITWKIDRFFRKLSYLLDTVEELWKLNVDFVSATEVFDTSAVWKLMFQMLWVLAEFERNMIMQRTREWRMESSRQGNYVWWWVPFGFTVEEKKIFVFEDEARYVRKIFEWFAVDNKSVEYIAETMTKLKILTKWDKTKKKNTRTANPLCHWLPSSIRKILKSEKYIWKYYYNRTSKDSNWKKKENPRSEWVEFECPKIVDEWVFQKAQERMKESKKKANNTNRKYLFWWKIRCWKCSSWYTWRLSTKKTKNYICIKRNPSKTATPCDAKEISELQLESAIWGTVKNFLEKPEKEIKTIIKSFQQEPYYKELQNIRAELSMSLKKEQEARKRVQEWFKLWVYDANEVQEELKTINERRQDLQDEIVWIDEQLTIEIWKKQKTISAKEMYKKYKNNLENITYDWKYEVLQALVKRVVIDWESVKFELAIPDFAQKKLNQWKSSYGVKRGTWTPDLRVMNPTL